MSSTFVSTERRADSVGWAVKIGRNSSRASVSATRTGSTPWSTIRSRASRSHVSPSRRCRAARRCGAPARRRSRVGSTAAKARAAGGRSPSGCRRAALRARRSPLPSGLARTTFEPLRISSTRSTRRRHLRLRRSPHRAGRRGDGCRAAGRRAAPRSAPGRKRPRGRGHRAARSPRLRTRRTSSPDATRARPTGRPAPCGCSARDFRLGGDPYQSPHPEVLREEVLDPRRRGNRDFCDFRACGRFDRVNPSCQRESQAGGRCRSVVHDPRGADRAARRRSGRLDRSRADRLGWVLRCTRRATERGWRRVRSVDQPLANAATGPVVATGGHERCLDGERDGGLRRLRRRITRLVPGQQRARPRTARRRTGGRCWRRPPLARGRTPLPSGPERTCSCSVGVLRCQPRSSRATATGRPSPRPLVAGSTSRPCPSVWSRPRRGDRRRGRQRDTRLLGLVRDPLPRSRHLRHVRWRRSVRRRRALALHRSPPERGVGSL